MVAKFVDGSSFGNDHLSSFEHEKHTGKDKRGCPDKFQIDAFPEKDHCEDECDYRIKVNEDRDGRRIHAGDRPCRQHVQQQVQPLLTLSA